MFLKKFSMALSAQNPKENYLSLQFFAFSRWIAIHVQEIDGLIVLYRFAARKS